MVNVKNAVSCVSLDEAKAQLRIDPDDHREDALIEMLIHSATMGAETRLKRPIISREGESIEGICNSIETVPDSIKHWVLLTVAYWFAHRELVSAEATHEMPFADNLLDAWRLYE